MDYPGKNDTSPKVSSLKEIVPNITENLAKVEHDTISLEPIMWKEALKTLITLYNFSLQHENSSPEF